MKIYERYSNYRSLLGNESIIYIFNKNLKIATEDLKAVQRLCKSKHISTSKIYIDYGNIDKLNYRISLKKLISENKNNNILILNETALVKDKVEFMDLSGLCYKNNLNIYDLTADDFVVNKKIIKNEFLFKESGEEMQRKIDILYIEPNKLPVKKTINNTLEAKQQLVDGKIQYTYLSDCDDVVIICNESSKILGLPYNRDIGHDIIAGNFLIVGDDVEHGEDRSLTQEQLDKYTKYFDEKSIEKTNKKVSEILMYDSEKEVM